MSMRMIESLGRCELVTATEAGGVRYEVLVDGAVAWERWVPDGVGAQRQRELTAHEQAEEAIRRAR